MTNLTQKSSKQFLDPAMRVVTLTLFLVAFGASAALAQTRAYVTNITDNTVSVIDPATNTAQAAADEQVSFTATGTAVITSVTHLPGGLTQINTSTSGTATHLGNFTGPITRIQDNQGNFGSTAVAVGANGKDSVFFSVSGSFERAKDKCLVTSTGTYRDRRRGRVRQRHGEWHNQHADRPVRRYRHRDVYGDDLQAALGRSSTPGSLPDLSSEQMVFL